MVWQDMAGLTAGRVPRFVQRYAALHDDLLDAARRYAADVAPCVAAVAGCLPFGDQSFDAAMAVLSDHHWPEPVAGLREMRRVARRVVVFQFDTADAGGFWLTRDYLPEFTELTASGPALAGRARAIGARMEPVPVPWDCADGFLVSSTPTGGGPRNTCARTCGGEARCGPGWGRLRSSGQFAACTLTLPPAGGLTATVPSPAWIRQNLAPGCLWPDLTPAFIAAMTTRRRILACGHAA
jgi:SAM-dependent methyltransferase